MISDNLAKYTLFKIRSISKKAKHFVPFSRCLGLVFDQNLNVLVFLLIFAVNIFRTKKIISTALRIENPGEILVEIRIGGRTESGKG